MMKSLAAVELVRIVILVRGEMFAQNLFVDTQECSQVRGEARLCVKAGEPTFADVQNRTRSQTADV